MSKKIFFVATAITVIALYSIASVHAQEYGASTQSPSLGNGQTQNDIGAQVSDGSVFSINPVHPNALDKTILIYEAKPGETIRDEIVVANNSIKTNHYRLYPTAREYSPERGNFFLAFDDTQELIGKWTSLAETQIDVKPSTSKKIPITIKIPKDTPLDNYWGGIALEMTRPSSTNATLTIATRYIMDIRIKVTDDPKPVPKFVPTKIPPPAPTPYFIGSMVLFTICMGYVVYSNRKDKKKQKK